MKNTLTFSALFVLFILASCTSEQSNENEKDDSISQSDTISLKDIQGSWNCVYSVYDDPQSGKEGTPPYSLETPKTLLIDNDSMFYFNFPCELVAARKVAIKEGFIFRPEQEEPSEGSKIWFANDTLCFFAGDKNGYYEEQRYVRVNLNDTILNDLRIHPINPNCLIGEWELILKDETDEDSSLWEPIQFPFEVEQTMRLDAHEVQLRLVKGWRLIVWADGFMREFDIVYLAEDASIMALQTQSSWFPDYELSNHYRGFTFYFTKKDY